VSSKTLVATIAGSATTSSRPRASRADRATNSARSAVKSKNDAGQIHRDDTAEVFNGPIQLDCQRARRRQVDFPCHANTHVATINAKLDGELVDRADHVHHADGISITERRPLLAFGGGALIGRSFRNAGTGRRSPGSGAPIGNGRRAVTITLRLAGAPSRFASARV
jgi:hypothetical protein